METDIVLFLFPGQHLWWTITILILLHSRCVATNTGSAAVLVNHCIYVGLQYDVLGCLCSCCFIYRNNIILTSNLNFGVKLHKIELSQVPFLILQDDSTIFARKILCKSQCTRIIKQLFSVPAIVLQTAKLLYEYRMSTITCKITIHHSTFMQLS